MLIDFVYGLHAFPPFVRFYLLMSTIKDLLQKNIYLHKKVHAFLPFHVTMFIKNKVLILAIIITPKYNLKNNIEVFYMSGYLKGNSIVGEEKIQFKPVKYSLFAVIAVLMCVLTIFFAEIATSNLKSKSDSAKRVSVDSGWNITYNDDEYRNVTLSEFKFPVAEKGDTITMVGKLPQKVIQNAAMIMYIRYTDFSASINGREFFSYSKKRYDEGKITGSGTLSVCLPYGYQGKTIKIVMRVGENQAFSSIGAPLIVNQESRYKEYAAENIWTLMISFFLVLFGIVLVVCGTMSAIFKTLEQSSIAKLVWMALFSISAGFWILCTSELTELFSSDLVFKVYLEYICVYTAPFFFLCYHTDGNDNNKRAIRRYLFRSIAIANMIFIGVVFILQALQIVNMPSFLILGQILDVFTLAYVLTTRLLDIKRKVTNSYYSIIGTLVVTIYAFWELIVFNYAKYVDKSGDAQYQVRGFKVAVLIFASSLFLDYINDTIRSERNKAKIDVMSHLAYTDALTGINNRQATEDYFDKVDRDNNFYSVIEFDLNELKKVNDEQGHEQGDDYIRSFANVLLNASKGWGFIGRIGGDEFTAVIVSDEYTLKDETEKFLMAFKREMKRENSYNRFVNISAAVGVCYYNEKGVHSIRSALKIADKRMYNNKAEMKKDNTKI